MSLVCILTYKGIENRRQRIPFFCLSTWFLPDRIDIHSIFKRRSWMRSRALIVVGLCLGSVLSLGILSTAQAPEYQLYAITEMIVQPAKSADFEAVMKEWTAFYVKNNYPWPYAVYRTEDFRYYLLTPMKDMAEFDAMVKADMELAKKGGPEFEAMMKRTGGSMAFYNGGALVLRNDLSYVPEKPRVKMEDAPFICWDYYYILPERQNEAEQIAKEWQALYKSKNLPDAFQVWMLVMGPDLPLIVASRWGKSEADFNAEDEKNLKKMGEAYPALAKKTMALCRKYERRTGYRLDSLSYAPAAK